MDNIIQYVTTHQFTVGVAVFVAFLLLYVIFKKLLKLALLLILLLLAMGGYMYFKDPKRMPENIQETLQKAKQQTGRVVETGKSVYDKGKTIVEKGQKLTKEAEKFLGEGKEATKER
jgi:ABC-type bacteriocin/lantibiotic exporter with double-glycine peptidase domain